MMRKRMMTPPAQTSPPLAQEWLDLQSAASVEITSEDAAFPIEFALLQQEKGGWRATEPGVQTMRLIFDEPQKLRRISLAFEETETSRTQEFTLRWSPDRGNSFREIVRQQWNFSSPVARHHQMNELWICCNPENRASRKTCERVGAELVEIIEVPPGTDLYERGDRANFRYRLRL